MVKSQYGLSLLLLAIFGLSTEYINRAQLLGEVPEITFRKYVFSVFFVIFLLKINSVHRIIAGGSFLRALVATVFITTFLGFIYAQLSGINVPFSISIRVLVQFVAFTSAIVAGISVATIILAKPVACITALNVGLLISFFGMLFQLAFEGGALTNGRLFGLNGEPKGLALYLVPFVIAHIIAPIYRGQIKFLLVAAMILALFATKSATGILALVLMFVITIFTLGVTKKRKMLLLSWGLFFIVSFIWIASTSEQIRYMLMDRFLLYASGDTIEGIQVAVQLPILGNITVEGNDAPVVQWLIDNPVLLFFGNGYGMETVFSYKYIQLWGGSGFLGEDYTGYISPNLAIVVNILNYGLVLLIGMFFLILKSLRNIKRRSLSIEQIFLFVFFASHFFVSLFIVNTGLPLIFSFLVTYIIANRYSDRLIFGNLYLKLTRRRVFPSSFSARNQSPK